MKETCKTATINTFHPESIKSLPFAKKRHKQKFVNLIAIPSKFDIRHFVAQSGNSVSYVICALCFVHCACQIDGLIKP